MRQKKYWRVMPKSGKAHLAIEDSENDCYQTFCGSTIRAERLEVATVVECYSGDECQECQRNVDVEVRVPDPEAPPDKPRTVNALVVRLKRLPVKRAIAGTSDLSGYLGQYVGFVVGFSGLPDIRLLRVFNSLDASCRVFRVFL